MKIQYLIPILVLMTVILGLSLLVCCASDYTTYLARITAARTYDKLNDEATFVVIATPTKVTSTSERAGLSGIVPVAPIVIPRANNNDVIGMGVETTFEVLAVLKGDRNVKTFVLHHYKLSDADEKALRNSNVANPPMLVSFDPKDEKTYLLFLRLEADGRYAAVTGQTDSYLSVQQFTVDSRLHQPLGGGRMNNPIANTNTTTMP